ncbi:MAG: phosphoribosylanthranilate isomerase [Candidatus Omnitrophica bacterium]|nr:phosphoribosylanthranilate isomerase [Candidatus Omnitrophota bacterium]
MVKVKICGITNLEDALLASESGADALGFIFVKKSPRCIKEEKAKKIIEKLDPFLFKVGVFLDEEEKKVADTASFLNLDALQFHGSESAAYCRLFMPRYRVIKTVFPENPSYRKEILRYKVDAFLFDIKFEEKQKKAKTLSARTLKEIFSLKKQGLRVIVSGGLNPYNIKSLSKLKPYAVDAASQIEKLVGKKDEKAMVDFIKKAKEI